MSTSLLRIRPDTVISETIGDDTMIIDTLSGAFYTIRGIGSSIWKLLENGVTRDGVVNTVRTHYPGEDSELAVGVLIDTLLEHAVLVETTSDSGAKHDVSDGSNAAWPASYSVPLVERHEDMSDLLLVDPLHDVDDSGWPHRAV